MAFYKVTAQVWETFEGFTGGFGVPVFYVDGQPESLTDQVCAIVGKAASHVAFVAEWTGPDALAIEHKGGMFARTSALDSTGLVAVKKK